MECYGKKQIIWRAKDGTTGQAIVRCGSCIPCLLSKANEWALRCALECESCSEACCLTLTISDDYLQEKFSHGVNRREIQLFLKRLRRKVGNNVRYFGCAEYGSLRGRPHYHVIIFGWVPKDLVFFKKSPTGHNIYVSHQLSWLWPYGYATVEEFDEAAAAYCSKYLNKIKEPIPDKTPPFTFMSLKPSIGFNAIVDSEHLKRGYIYHKGKKCVIPRSFYQSLKRRGIEFPELAEARKRFVEALDDDEQFVKETNSINFSLNLLDKLHLL